MLVLNRYKCPINGNVTSQAHLINSDFEIETTYPKMAGDSLELFNHHDKILVIDVIRSHNLASVNLINNKTMALKKSLRASIHDNIDDDENILEKVLDYLGIDKTDNYRLSDYHDNKVCQVMEIINAHDYSLQKLKEIHDLLGVYVFIK